MTCVAEALQLLLSLISGTRRVSSAQASKKYVPLAVPALTVAVTVPRLLIMMGQHDRSEALFYYFRLEDQAPETHLLRLIERHISFAFVREIEAELRRDEPTFD